jgi:hypothetical protein
MSPLLVTPLPVRPRPSTLAAPPSSSPSAGHCDCGLEADEWQGGLGSSALAALDGDHDDILTPDELYRNAVSVRNMYQSTRTITLGQTRVVLIHAGPGDVPELTLLYFPDDRVVFSTEHPRIGEPPITFDPIPLDSVTSARGFGQ